MSNEQLKTRAEIHRIFAEILLRYSTVNQLLQQAAETNEDTYKAALDTFNAEFWPEMRAAQSYYHTDPTTPEVIESYRKRIIQAWESVSLTIFRNQKNG